MMESFTESQSKPEKSSLWRLLPLAILAIGAALFFIFGLHHYLTFDALREHREVLVVWVDANVFLAALGYILIYALAVVFVPPSGTVVSLAGGFFFGVIAGTFNVVLGATIGATALFLVTRHSVGNAARKLEGTRMKKMEAGFRNNELSYMLFLRLIPLFPFWLVNIAPAFLGVSLRAYVIGTFIGIIPGVFVFVTVGAGLGTIFDANEEFSLRGVMTPEIIAGLVGLALLSLLPIIYKKIKHRKTNGKRTEG